MLLASFALLVGLGAGGACVTCLGLSDMKDRVYQAGRERVGVVEVVGTILDSKSTVQHLRDFARRRDLVGIVLRIDSPGGSVAPSQEIFEAVEWASKKKPVVASMGSVAASGGFWISLSADYVFASPGSVTGSIGVLTQSTDLRGIAELARVKVRTFKSGPLKDAGNPFREMTPDDEALFMSLINDIYEQFVTVTAERRKLTLARVRQLADGRVLTGRAAHEAGLVDGLGSLHDAARKAVELAALRQPARDQGAKTKTKTSTAGADGDDPTLVYPRPPTPNILELLSDSAASAIANGIDRALRAQATSSPSIEVR